jgi:hypothetical protein
MSQHCHFDASRSLTAFDRRGDRRPTALIRHVHRLAPILGGRTAEREQTVTVRPARENHQPLSALWKF